MPQRTSANCSFASAWPDSRYCSFHSSSRPLCLKSVIWRTTVSSSAVTLALVARIYKIVSRSPSKTVVNGCGNIADRRRRFSIWSSHFVYSYRSCWSKHDLYRRKCYLRVSIITLKLSEMRRECGKIETAFCRINFRVLKFSSESLPRRAYQGFFLEFFRGTVNLIRDINEQRCREICTNSIECIRWDNVIWPACAGYTRV